eukprot:9489483-Pyramimonas_sp.AAC.2
MPSGRAARYKPPSQPRALHPAIHQDCPHPMVLNADGTANAVVMVAAAQICRWRMVVASVATD